MNILKFIKFSNDLKFRKQGTFHSLSHKLNWYAYEHDTLDAHHTKCVSQINHYTWWFIYLNYYLNIGYLVYVTVFDFSVTLYSKVPFVNPFTNTY